MVKVNAVERLRAELRAPSWDGDHIAMGTNTDPYQHAEGKYHLTRGIVETLSGARNPFSILTKSTLILRDAAVLAAASERTDVGVSFSIGTLDRAVWKLTEPGTPPPDRRVEALRRLTAMGIPCGVLVAPVLPGLSDSEDQLTEVVEACAEAGAVSISGVALHLRGTVRGHYFDWLERERPDLVHLHRERFRRGGYQADEERQRVEGIVKVAARRCGVTGRNRYRGRQADGGDNPMAGARTPAAGAGGRRRPAAAPSLRGRVNQGACAPYDRGLMPGGPSLWRASRRAAVGLAALLAASALVVLGPGGPTSLATTAAVGGGADTRRHQRLLRHRRCRRGRHDLRRGRL